MVEILYREDVTFVSCAVPCSRSQARVPADDRLRRRGRSGERHSLVDPELREMQREIGLRRKRARVPIEVAQGSGPGAPCCIC